MKKIIAIVLTLSMVFSIPVFAEETTPAQPAQIEQTTAAPTTPEVMPASVVTTTTTDVAPATIVQATEDAGVTPDSILYSFDKLMERIQLALITDAVKEADTLAKIAQERLAEGAAMVEKADTDLAQKALEDYKASLDQSIALIQTAMEQGKQVAAVMNGINTANLKDVAVVQNILASIPEEYRDQVKAEIEKIAAATEATNDTAQVVENNDEEENSVKLDITMKLIEEKVQDPALIAKIKEAGLNTRQIIAVISLSEQSEKPLGEVLDMFIANEMGIGATAHELGLQTKDALKGINASFKDAKETIKKAFKEALKAVDEKDQAEVEDLVNETLAGTETAKTSEEIDALKAKLQKVVDDAKTQLAAIASTAKDKKSDKKAEKAIEKAKKEAEKAIEKAKHETEKALKKENKKSEKALEKSKHKSEKAAKAGDDNDDDNDDDEEDED